MAIRQVLEELEARLEAPSQGPMRGAPAGKLEFKHYHDGRRRLKIKCKGLDLADDSRLDVVTGDNVIAVLTVRNGRAELDQDWGGAGENRRLAVGDTVSLCDNGTPRLSGRLYLD